MPTLRPFRPLLAALLGLAWLVAPLAHADDYQSIRVPDLTQATAFFRDVLNCDTIAPADGGPTAILECGRNGVIELRQSANEGSRGQAPAALVLSTANLPSLTRWLTEHGVAVLGQPMRLGSGEDQGRLAVDVQTPWGLTIQLVGEATDNAPADTPAGHLAAE